MTKDTKDVSDRPSTLKDHNLVAETALPGILYEKRAAHTPDGTLAEGLYNAWITLDNPGQYNAFTTEMVKGAVTPRRRVRG